MLKKFTPFAIFIVYCLISVVFLRGILFSPGILMGGDWGFPQSQIQIERYFESGFYTWTDREILGDEQFFLNALPFQMLIGFIGKLGITGDIYTKAIIFIALVFSASTMYALCRFLNCDKKTSFLGGFLYMTLPFFFNYIAMGWVFVLFSMGILPLALMSFIKSVKEHKLSFAIITGILYSLAMLQSQSLVWYSLAFFSFIPHLIHDKKSLFVYLKSLLTVFLVFILLNAYWALPLFFGRGGEVLNTHQGASTTSLGTWARLNISNILRGWGSLFNEQYEASTYRSLSLLSFVLPLTAYSSLFLFKKNRLVTSLVLLSFIPVVLFELGPEFIVTLPFSDLIRDIARFSVISSFTYVVLATLVLNRILNHDAHKNRALAIVLSILLITATYPYWMGGLYGKSKFGHDGRLRSYTFAPEYSLIENQFSKDIEDIRVLHLPIAGELSILNDKRFDGVHRGIRDISASYFPKPGMVGSSERSTKITSNIRTEIEEQTNQIKRKENLSQLMGFMNIKYVIVRKNMMHPNFIPGYAIATALKKDRNFILLKEWSNIALFENKNVISHIYIPESIIISNAKIESLPKVASFENFNTRPAIYLTKQNYDLGTQDKLQNYNSIKYLTQFPIIESKKINPTLYQISIQNIKNGFPLVFSEAYNSNWKLYRQGSDQPLSEKNHFIANGYANAWWIESKQGEGTMQLTIEFLPQKLFRKGSIVSVVSFLVLLFYIIFTIIKQAFYGKSKT